MTKRSRRVVVLAHCILNGNAKYGGGATYAGANVEVLEPYLRDGVGIVQLPCPESSFLGMSRWGMTRNQYDNVAYRRHCAAILRPTIDTLEEFAAAGYAIEGVVGIKGSPSCGVTETHEGYEGGGIEGTPTCERVADRGVMMAVLGELLAVRGMKLTFTDVRDPD
ncbi:MAG: 2-thiouracil desulfurase family protein [Coriobacteriia bacterium]|nr:2-thiouracil desulfurase family protein [Coriobacteriia bacterium]